MNTQLASYLPDPSKVSDKGCISLIGMAAAGKTTIGRELSALLLWPQVDVDNIIEATYAAPLQTITNNMTKDEFLDLEGTVIKKLNINKVIISTGGSAVYRPQAIEHLQKLGPIIYISVPLPIILERIARKPERGLAIAPGQTIEDLYYERNELYEKAATYTVYGGHEQASVYAQYIAQWLSTPL